MEDLLQGMRVITSDDLGLLKVFEAKDIHHLEAGQTVATWGQPDRSRAVNRITCSSREGITDTDSAVFAAARKGGQVDIYNPCTGQSFGSIPSAALQDGQPQDISINGLHFLKGSSIWSLLCCTDHGSARVLSCKEASTTEQLSTWEMSAKWSVPENVLCSAFNDGNQVLALGCKGAELRTWDVSTQQCTWQGKGGKPNKVGLVDKPWNSAIAFLDPNDNRKVVVGTAYHKLRLYDVGAQKRPVMDLAFGEAKITSLAPEASGLRCWVGNGVGQIEVCDLRTSQMGGAAKGSGGAVHSLAMHPDQPLLASVGLDRHLRFYDSNTRQVKMKVYLKQQLTGVQFAPISPSAVSQKGQDAADDQPELSTMEKQQKDAKRDRKIKDKTLRKKSKHG